MDGLADFIRLERENYDYDEYYLRVENPEGKRLVNLSPPDQDALPDQLPLDTPGPSIQWFFLPEGHGPGLRL